jgi:hypothetical protein
MKATLNDASVESRPLGMHLLSSKKHDASDECQFKLMHPLSLLRCRCVRNYFTCMRYNHTMSSYVRIPPRGIT